MPARPAGWGSLPARMMAQGDVHFQLPYNKRFYLNGTWQAGSTNAIFSAWTDEASYNGEIAVSGRFTSPYFQAMRALGDVEAAGGFRQPIGPWVYDNFGLVAETPCGLGDVGRLGAWVAPRAGSIMGIVAHLSEAITQGTISFWVYKNGVKVAAATLAMTTGTTGRAVFAKDASAFAAGDYLQLYFATSGDFLPVTSDLLAGHIEVEC